MSHNTNDQVTPAEDNNNNPIPELPVRNENYRIGESFFVPLTSATSFEDSETEMKASWIIGTNVVTLRVEYNENTSGTPVEGEAVFSNQIKTLRLSTGEVRSDAPVQVFEVVNIGKNMDQLNEVFERLLTQRQRAVTLMLETAARHMQNGQSAYANVNWSNITAQDGWMSQRKGPDDAQAFFREHYGTCINKRELAQQMLTEVITEYRSSADGRSSAANQTQLLQNICIRVLKRFEDRF